jgi:hypothetical protein
MVEVREKHSLVWILYAVYFYDFFSQSIKQDSTVL